MEGKKTFLGIGIMLLAILQNQGHMAGVTGEEVASLIETIIGLTGAIIAFYGRLDVGQRLTEQVIENKVQSEIISNQEI